jgi:hypothetical protein
MTTSEKREAWAIAVGLIVVVAFLVWGPGLLGWLV